MRFPLQVEITHQAVFGRRLSFLSRQKHLEAFPLLLHFRFFPSTLEALSMPFHANRYDQPQCYSSTLIQVLRQ